jgi:hypothetical protein
LAKFQIIRFQNKEAAALLSSSTEQKIKNNSFRSIYFLKFLTTMYHWMQFTARCQSLRDKQVPVGRARRVLRLRVKELVPDMEGSKQSPTADKGWSSSLRVGRRANNS